MKFSREKIYPDGTAEERKRKSVPAAIEN